MAKIIRFPIGTPEKKGPTKVVRKRRKADPEDFGQLNLFDQSRIISFNATNSSFEKGLMLDGSDDEKALEFYQSATEEESTRADALCNIGIIKSRQGKLSQALDHLTKCLALSPRHFEAHYNLANVYSDQGNYDLARMHYELAIEINPEFIDSYYNLGLVHIALKSYEIALNWIDQYIQLSPSDEQEARDLSKSLQTIAK